MALSFKKLLLPAHLCTNQILNKKTEYLSRAVSRYPFSGSSLSPITSFKNWRAVTKATPTNSRTASTCASPVTTYRALCAKAQPSTILSFGSSNILPGKIISGNTMHRSRYRCTICATGRVTLSANLLYPRVVASSSSKRGEVHIVTLPAFSTSNKRRDGPLQRSPDTTVFVSRTIFIAPLSPRHLRACVTNRFLEIFLGYLFSRLLKPRSDFIPCKLLRRVNFPDEYLLLISGNKHLSAFPCLAQGRRKNGISTKCGELPRGHAKIIALYNLARQPPFRAKWLFYPKTAPPGASAYKPNLDKNKPQHI